MRRAAVAATAVALLLVIWAAPGGADAPVKDGWWSQTNVGLGFSAVPAQVPAGGLFVENGFNGPIAISALSFTVPSGATVGQMTLAVTGNPVITSPPVACALTSAGEAFRPAEGGRWSDRPAYDCSQGSVTATVASDKSSVSFDTGPLLHQGVIAVAIRAGGPADQIAFAPPDAGSLAVTPAGSGSAGTPGPPAGAGLPGVSGGSAAPAGSGVGGAGVPSTPIPGPAAASPSGPSPANQTPGTAAPSTSSGRPARAGRSPSSLQPSLARNDSSAQKAGETLGTIGLVGLLIAYTEGYGLLGGRIRPLARLQPSRSRPAYPAK